MQLLFEFLPLIAFFVAFMAFDLYVMYNFDLEVWAYFKTWGMIALSLLMAVGQAIWISSRATEPAAPGPGPGPGSSN